MDVWKVALEPKPGHEEFLFSVLRDDEKKRAEAYRFHRDRQRFVAARATLRLILGHFYLNKAPQEILLTYGSHGKPRLPNNEDGPPIRFNLAHSTHLSLLAISLKSDLGVDIEEIKPNIEIERIAVNFFSTKEQNALFAMPVGERRAAFIRIWTLKEAYIKARGLGLSIPLDSFHISPSHDADTFSIEVDGVPEASRFWTITNLPVDEGFVAALAMEGAPRSIRLYSPMIDQILEHAPMSANALS